MSELDVLVVEDDFMVASIHTRFVERVDGFRVVGVASTGTAALADVKRLEPDLLLLDVHLPDLSGVEVLRRLRSAGNPVGVVVITAAREADTVRAAAAGGAAHYLVKPFRFEDLSARLEAFRAAHTALQSTSVPDQADIDAVFAPLPRSREALPKGLSLETADAVVACLRAADGDVSASECGAAVGISRVSARRYLEHLTATGTADVRLKYGGAGRPERRYRLTRRP